MAPPTQPLIPGIDQVIANLRSIPVVTGTAEQFIGPAGSGPPALTNSPQYSDLEIQQRSVTWTAFNSFDHSQLVANVEPIQLASVEAFRSEWANSANTVADTFETFATKIGVAISEKWQGPAGEAASTAIVGYAQKSTQMADASNLVARQVGLLADSLDRTKTNLPAEPAETVPSKILGIFGKDDHDDERRNTAKTNAALFLHTVYYGAGISPTAQGMPVFPAVQSPIADSPTGGPFMGGPGTPSNGGGNPTSASPTSPAQPGTPAGSGTNPGTLPENTTSGTPTDALSALESLGPDETGGPDSPTSTVAASSLPSSAAGLGAGGLGSGGGSGTGGFGSSGPGTPPSPAGPLAGPAGVGGTQASATGRPGMPGMGMAPMGGARGAGGGKDDEEHTTPDYLHNDELRQWVDEQSARGYAPVIGAQRPPRPNVETGSRQQ